MRHKRPGHQGGSGSVKEDPPVAFALTEKECFGPYDVMSLSRGGMILCGRHPPVISDVSEIILPVEGNRQACVPARVVFLDHVGSEGFAFAVSFDKALEGKEIAGRWGSRASGQAPAVLVVDDSEGVCHALGRDLRALGRRSVSAANPLDGVMCLIDPDTFIDSASVDLNLGRSDGLDLLAFLTSRHPDVRRVLISGQVRMERLNLARDSGQAQAVLQKPWSRDDLAGALELSGRTAGAK